MKINTIVCEAVTVRTDSNVCPGLAKTHQGEVHEIGPRTPTGIGICCQAFDSLNSMRLAMAYTKKMSWETQKHFDIMCPHGVVTFRLSRKEM